jgi:hypothetical protein
MGNPFYGKKKKIISNYIKNNKNHENSDTTVSKIIKNKDDVTIPTAQADE